MYEISFSEAVKKYPIRLEDGTRGHGLYIKDLRKIFVKQGFKPKRADSWIKEWIEVGMMIEKEDENGFTAYMFPTLMSVMKRPTAGYIITPRLPTAADLEHDRTADTQDITAWG